MSDLRLIGGDLLPPRSDRRHLLSVSDLTSDDVDRLLATAGSFSLSVASSLGVHAKPWVRVLSPIVPRRAARASVHKVPNGRAGGPPLPSCVHR